MAALLIARIPFEAPCSDWEEQEQEEDEEEEEAAEKEEGWASLLYNIKALLCCWPG